MKLYRLFIIGFLFSTSILKAQTDFKPGFVVKNSGDTIFGEIDYRGDLLMGKICKFKGADHPVEEYSPNDVVSFRFIDSKYYISKEVDSKKVFLQYLIKGKVNVYYLRDHKGEHYYLDKEGSELTEIPYKEGIIYINDKPYFSSTNKHLGVLSFFMQEDPDIQEKVQKVKKPQHKNLIKLAEDYHNTVCDGEKCILYEKRQFSIKVIPELLAGLIYFNGEELMPLSNAGIIKIDKSTSKYFFNGGLITNLWLPSVNEKLYLRTGLLCSRIQSDNGPQSIYKLPIQIEYIYPKSIIRPKIAMGINLYKPFNQSVGFMGGVVIRLHKNVFLSVNCDMDFIPSEKIPLMPNKLLTYSILTGIKVPF